MTRTSAVEAAAILFALAAILLFWVAFEPAKNPTVSLPARATARDHSEHVLAMVAGSFHREHAARLIQEDRP